MRRGEATSLFQAERLTPLRIGDRFQQASYPSIRRADLKRGWPISRPRWRRRTFEWSETAPGTGVRQERNPGGFSLSAQSRFAAASSLAAADGSVILRLTKYSPVVFSTSGED